MLLPSLRTGNVAHESDAEGTARDQLSQEPLNPDSLKLLITINEEPDEQAESSAADDDGDGDGEARQSRSPQAGIADDSAFFEAIDEIKATVEAGSSLNDQEACHQARTFNAVHTASNFISLDSEPVESKYIRDVTFDALKNTQDGPDFLANLALGVIAPNVAIGAELAAGKDPRSPVRSPPAAIAGVAPRKACSPRADTPAAISSLADVSLAAQVSSSQKRSLPRSGIANDDLMMDTRSCAGGRVAGTETTLEAAGEHAETKAAPRRRKKARFAKAVKVQVEAGQYIHDVVEVSNGFTASQPVASHPVRVG